MTNSLILHNNFTNSAFYDYLKSIGGNILVYYYPRLGTYLKDLFFQIDLNEIRNKKAKMRFKFQPFFTDQSEKLQIQDDAQNFPTTLYIIPPDIKILSLIVKNAQNVNENANENDNHSSPSDKKILFFPQKTEECISWLNSHNSQDNRFFIDENCIEFDFLPIYDRIHVIPFVDFFYRVFEKQDFSLLKICTDVLTKIQFFYGKIPRVKIHGQISKKIYDMFLEITSKVSDTEFPKSHIFNNLIIIDRTSDLLTPLLPQISYDGVIEESFTLDDGMISIPQNNTTTEYSISHKMTKKIEWIKATKSEIKSREDQQDKILSIKNKINSQIKEYEITITDHIHDYLKHRTVLHDINYLNEVIKNIREHRSEHYETNENKQEILINGKVYESTDLSILEQSAQYLLDLITNIINRRKEYVAYMDLRKHLELGLKMNFDSFRKAIHTFLYAEENALFATQLIMTWCMINGSVPIDAFEEFCNEIEFRYGSQASEQLHFLQNIGLITPTQIRNPYSKLNDAFNLSMNKSKKSDSFDGYVPLSVRFIQDDLETIPGSFTKRKDKENDDSPLRERDRMIDEGKSKQSFIDMLSSTVGNRPINFKRTKSKRINSLNTFFDDQYYCNRFKYVNLEKEKIDEKVLDNIINNKENTLVFFVGGITQFELSWLNWLSEEHFKERSTIVTLTTGLYTADKFIKECLPCLREDHPSLKVMTDNAIKLYSTNHY